MQHVRNVLGADQRLYGTGRVEETGRARVLPGAIQRREITPNRNFFQIAMYFWTIFASLMFEGTFYVRR